MADVQKFLQQIADRRAGKIPNTKYATQRDYKTNMAARYEREKFDCSRIMETNETR